MLDVAWAIDFNPEFRLPGVDRRHVGVARTPPPLVVRGAQRNWTGYDDTGGPSADTQYPDLQLYRDKLASLPKGP